MLVYMKSNVNKDGTCNLKGTNGRPVFMGAGLLEQIAPSNKRYYTRLTAGLLEDFLFDLSYNVLGTNFSKFESLGIENSPNMSIFPLLAYHKICNDHYRNEKWQPFEPWTCNIDRKSTRLNSSHSAKSRMPSSA